ncbi:short-chain alcohol protein [Purpureocillium lavendulum]|uniref:Short-chain alcohol protein n=1 Tax=Purpureocillium lavendulum TaxID=1247861 RepID=A0AB34G0X4_9HYPO|nr:short-chain alcohol protein [Purpureocillium lavendulum]
MSNPAAPGLGHKNSTRIRTRTRTCIRTYARGPRLPRTDRSLVLIGSGPGIGRHVAVEFARKRFNKVALIARNPAQLADDKAVVEAAAGEQVTVKTFAVDVTDTAKFRSTLDDIRKVFGAPECVYFNAARVIPTQFFAVKEEETLYAFKTNVTALYATAEWALPQLVALKASDPDAQPSFLVTNSLLPKFPIADLFVLSMVKAAQRNMMQSLSDVYAPQGVHVGVIAVGGPVDPSAPTLNPPNIAARAWEFFNQNDFEVEIM